MDKRAIVQRALENVNHPLSEITGRTKFRGHSPTVAPVTGIKMALPKTSTMAKKMQKLQDSWADLTTSGCEKDHQETCFDEARRQDKTGRLVLDENEDQHNHLYDNGNGAEIVAEVLPLFPLQ